MIALALPLCTDCIALVPTIPDDSATPPPGGPEVHRRAVRSFVARAGRMTTAQERAWRDLWPRYGIPDDDGTLDFDTHPEQDFVGIEVHRPGVGHLLLRAEALGLANLRVASRDAVELLEQRVPDASLDAVLLYFPDPWPKKRHHKRRIVQPPFVALVSRKLKRGGRFRLATDWQHYAEQMLEVVAADVSLENEFGNGYAPRPDSRPLTRFETRGQRLGHEVWDLCFRKR